MIHLRGAPGVAEKARSIAPKMRSNALKRARSLGNGAQWLYKFIGVCRLEAEGTLTVALYYGDVMP